MPTRIGKYTVELTSKPVILGSASVVGKKEGEGPLGQYYDQCHNDTTLGESSWEKAESRLQNEAVVLAVEKANLKNSDIDCILAGDLLNQCISSTFGLRSLNIPFLGQFGACSTMAQTLAIASLFTESGAARRAVAVTSSHFCSAERQFRFPLEYGGQRTPTAQWTATAAGAIVMGSPQQKQEGQVVVDSVTFGRITDFGIKDAANMGAAMAPAAAQTLIDYLSDTGASPKDFDLILTGDLGSIGSDLMEKLLMKDGIDISAVHNDCGLMIYDIEKQDVHAGGSGCGCSGAVLCSYIMQQMLAGKLHKVLFLGTGALMSPTSSQQGESIPGVAHLVLLKA
ncbi:stage V sporulation protein AD [Caproiciproducens sp. CPB-2]|uniref:stage V sporulation protein AD n=1 Tax=unclassified Caproiciproducens TaxID=2643836 RepID=UPI0023DA8D6F|nr:stage V sporulation protein AD [Caproiciproducens sp. CPB-2]MDF1496087.1 stage V sporulation protein AD [Caproiciproducens sp. CPB-2]